MGQSNATMHKLRIEMDVTDSFKLDSENHPHLELVALNNLLLLAQEFFHVPTAIHISPS